MCTYNVYVRFVIGKFFSLLCALYHGASFHEKVQQCRNATVWSDLATERERHLTTARTNQTTGLTNGRAANWAPEVVFSPFHALSRHQLTFPSCC